MLWYESGLDLADLMEYCINKYEDEKGYPFGTYKTWKDWFATIVNETDKYVCYDLYWSVYFVDSKEELVKEMEVFEKIAKIGHFIFDKDHCGPIKIDLSRITKG